MTASTSIRPGRPEAAVDPAGDLCRTLLTSLPRTDQRARGAEYVRGLLAAEGRKSVRNIAAAVGGRATEQNLHHFISSSTWDWQCVRRALAGHVSRTTNPHAFVVRHTVIPKSGNKAAGVSRRYHSCHDRTLNAQVAAGLWSAGDGGSTPTNWCLHLPVGRGGGASAATELAAGAGSLEECAFRSVTDMMTVLPRRPVLVDARGLDARTLIERFTSVDVPAMLRVGADLELLPRGSALPGCSGSCWRASTMLNAARRLRSPVVGPDGSIRTVAAVGASIPPGDRRERTHAVGPQLVGIGVPGQQWPSQVWLTTLLRPGPGELAYLSALPDVVERDMLDVADDVGIRDYVGRSFGGWHRHMTLASVAHLVRIMSRQLPAEAARPLESARPAAVL